MKKIRNRFSLSFLLTIFVCFVSINAQPPGGGKILGPATKKVGPKIMAQATMASQPPTSSIVNTYPTLFSGTTGLDVYFAFENPLNKTVWVAANQQSLTTPNLLKRIDSGGNITDIPLAKCKGMGTYGNMPAILKVQSISFNGEIVATGQFDRCEGFSGDTMGFPAQGIVKFKANGQMDTNFKPDFYQANNMMCQTNQMTQLRYCPPVPISAVQTWGNGNYIWIYGYFQYIGGTQLPNTSNLVKLDFATGQKDPMYNFTAALGGAGFVKGITFNGHHIYGQFDLASPARKNIMYIDQMGSIQSDPSNFGTGVDGPINSVFQPINPTGSVFGVAGSFTKFKGVTNYPNSPGNIPIKNIHQPGTVGSNYYISWETETPFTIESADITMSGGSSFGMCGANMSDGLICFRPGMPNKPAGVVKIPVSGNVKVVHNVFNTNDFYIAGNFSSIAGQSVNGFARITFSPN